MLIGIVSDTHGQLEYTRPAVRMLESCAVELVIHCGDIGSPEIVELFRPWPAHFVFGNVDQPEAPLRAAIVAAGQTCHGRFGDLELAGVSIAFLHGDDVRLLGETIRAEKYHVVCHGHTHVARNEHVGGTLVVNPGALYRARPHSIALIELPRRKATIVAL